VTVGGGVDVVNGFTNSLKGGGCTNSQIRQAHIIVDGADKADDFEMSVLLGLLVRNQCYKTKTSDHAQEKRGKAHTLLLETANEIGPFAPENVCTSKRSISSTYNESVDALFDKIKRAGRSTLDGLERH
jgi:hypothetical protein